MGPSFEADSAINSTAAMPREGARSPESEEVLLVGPCPSALGVAHIGGSFVVSVGNAFGHRGWWHDRGAALRFMQIWVDVLTCRSANMCPLTAAENGIVVVSC